MELLVLILNDVSRVPKILSAFMEAGIPGTTVVECHGAMRVLRQSQVEPPPIFGALRHIIHEEYSEGRILLTVLSDEQLATARAIIRQVVGDLSQPDTGILFAMPITSVEGLIKS